MTLETMTRAERIAELNDRCRLGLDRNARQMLTANCHATMGELDTVRGIVATANLLREIRNYQFKPGDREERDYGSFEFHGHAVCFKIDCYDLDLAFGSEDPADASVTRRVMTVMLTSDY